MMDSQRELLERFAASDHLVAMGKIGAGAVAAALRDLDAKDRRIAKLEVGLDELAKVTQHRDNLRAENERLRADLKRLADLAKKAAGFVMPFALDDEGPDNEYSRYTSCCREIEQIRAALADEEVSNG